MECQKENPPLPHCHYDYHYHRHLPTPYDDKRSTIWMSGEYQAQLPLHHYPATPLSPPSAITLLPHIDPFNATKRGATYPTI